MTDPYEDAQDQPVRDDPAQPGRAWVESLPDLIQPEEYPDHPGGALMRLRITATAQGVEVLGDAFRPLELEKLLGMLGPHEIEQMLCG